MKNYEEIKNNYINAYNERVIKLTELEKKVEKLNKKIEKLNKEYVGTISHFWKPLAEEIKERCGFKCYEIYGPFGLDGETNIYFANEGEQGKIDICNVETWSLEFKTTEGHEMTPIWEDNKYLGRQQIIKYKPTYNTGERTESFNTSISYLNGFDKKRKELPNDIEEIIKLLNHNTLEKKE